MNTAELTDLLIQQNHIGSVIKVSGAIDTTGTSSSLAPAERSNSKDCPEATAVVQDSMVLDSIHAGLQASAMGRGKED